VKTIYLVRLRFTDSEKDLGSCGFIDHGDAVRYRDSLDGGMHVSIQEVELYARNEWNPLPILEESCV